MSPTRPTPSPAPLEETVSSAWVAQCWPRTNTTASSTTSSSAGTMTRSSRERWLVSGRSRLSPAQDRHRSRLDEGDLPDPPSSCRRQGLRHPGLSLHSAPLSSGFSLLFAVHFASLGTGYRAPARRAGNRAHIRTEE